MCVCVCDRQTDRQTDRHRETERDRESTVQAAPSPAPAAQESALPAATPVPMRYSGHYQCESAHNGYLTQTVTYRPRVKQPKVNEILSADSFGFHGRSRSYQPPAPAVCPGYIRGYTRAPTRADTHARAHARTHTHTYTHARAHTRARTHTRTRRVRRTLKQRGRRKDIVYLRSHRQLLRKESQQQLRLPRRVQASAAPPSPRTALPQRRAQSTPQRVPRSPAARTQSALPAPINRRERMRRRAPAAREGGGRRARDQRGKKKEER
eukprot:COSAG03_NODE_1681_length_3651_cov_3.501688_3_plen_266_part_00